MIILNESFFDKLKKSKQLTKEEVAQYEKELNSFFTSHLAKIRGELKKIIDNGTKEGKAGLSPTSDKIYSFKESEKDVFFIPILHYDVWKAYPKNARDMLDDLDGEFPKEMQETYKKCESFVKGYFKDHNIPGSWDVDGDWDSGTYGFLLTISNARSIIEK